MITKEFAKQRSFLMRAVRDFFDERRFLEVETPIMTLTVDPEPALTPFETRMKFPRGFPVPAPVLKNLQVGNSEHRDSTGADSICGVSLPAYLVTSPELQMKKLLGAGFGSIYTITKVFRNGEVGGGRHNPEFTMLEWYRENADYMDVMKDTEELVRGLAKAVLQVGRLPGEAIDTINLKGCDLSEPFERKSLNELFIEKCGIDLLENRDFETFKKTAEMKGHTTGGCESWDDILYKIFLNDIEPMLGFEKPIFVYDYPATQGALARKKESEPFWVERFELYINGWELCNAFSELLDVDEQRKRFEEANEARARLKKTQFDIDGEFLKSLESIRHPVGGNALGIDRLMMVLFGFDRIEDVMAFPVEEMVMGRNGC